jgi:hypothetical protein
LANDAAERWGEKKKLLAFGKALVLTRNGWPKFISRIW